MHDRDAIYDKAVQMVSIQSDKETERKMDGKILKKKEIIAALLRYCVDKSGNHATKII